MAIAAELKERARQALEELAPNHREVIELIQKKGLTMKETAARMERSVPAVKQLYGRALSSLAKLMGVPFDRKY